MQSPQPDLRTGSNWSQLKDDINRGDTGDKVAGFDPAAAPLGVDAEAGGEPTEPMAIDQARKAERRAAHSGGTANAATPELQPDGRLARRPWLVPLLLGGGVAAALVLGVAVFV